MKHTQSPTLTPLQSFVLAALKESKKPVRRDELQRRIYQTHNNRNNDRSIQTAIRALRMIGFVIVSNSEQSGYKLATTDAEVNRYVSERMKAAREMMRTARKVQKAFKARNQMVLMGTK